MYIRGSDGTSFQLEIVGYQYPELIDVEHDSNWLCMSMSAILPKGSWSVIDPFLLTYEVAKLADWLDAIATHSETQDEMGFVEPNISFEVVRRVTGQSCLRVYFRAECKPPWAGANETGGTDIIAEFALAEIDLRLAAESLRAQLSIYPQRTAL